ncbi:MAG: GIY-YIG nuclease family protein [Candidatus Ratteibacteria bacterium]|nr:GIY-YIG nuclease family protein [Candidatus Ratteibacteria bacterium]
MLQILARPRLSPPKAAEGGSASELDSLLTLRTIMHYIYILLNEAKTRTYTGVTDDFEKRLKEHNAGRVKSSRAYRPYKIVHTESFETLSEARQKETFYKSTTGRRRLKEMLFK